MRDISRMFEGLFQTHKQVITNKVELLRLWLHEAHRVYSDRFISNDDHDLFVKILSEKLAFHFDQVYHNVCFNREAPIYSDVLRTDGVYEVDSGTPPVILRLRCFSRKFAIATN